MSRPRLVSRYCCTRYAKTKSVCACVCERERARATAAILLVAVWTADTIYTGPITKYTEDYNNAEFVALTFCVLQLHHRVYKKSNVQIHMIRIMSNRARRRPKRQKLSAFTNLTKSWVKMSLVENIVRVKSPCRGMARTQPESTLSASKQRETCHIASIAQNSRFAPTTWKRIPKVCLGVDGEIVLRSVVFG